MHLIILVENPDEIQQLFLRGIFVQAILERTEADFLACLLLVADIDLGGGVISHENDCQTGVNAVVLPKRSSFLPNLGAKRCRNGLTRN